MKARDIIRRIADTGSDKNREGMKRYGIYVERAYGVSVRELRKFAKEIGMNHDLALDLWETGIHEARLLAGFIADPEKMTEELIEKCVSDFDSWDICDQVCSNLFDRTSFAYKKAVEWSSNPEEFIKRAGFVMMAALSVHDKKAPNKVFTEFLPIILKESIDERNFVKKAVNWALRQIGKRNPALNKKAVKIAMKLANSNPKSSKWIGKDALRELQSEKIQKMLAKNS